MNQTGPDIAGKVYSVASGDRGRVTINGVEVNAVACCPGDPGWADIIQPERFIPNRMTAIPRARQVGRVEFFPFERDAD